MLRKYAVLALVLFGIASSLAHAVLPSWEQKYADESSLDLLVERTVELRKDWLTQFNQVHIK